MDAADEEESDDWSVFRFLSGPYGMFFECDTLRFESDTARPVAMIERHNVLAPAGYVVEVFRFFSGSNRTLGTGLYVDDMLIELENGSNIPLSNPSWLRSEVPSLSQWGSARLTIHGSSCINGEPYLCPDNFRIVARITSLQEP